MRRLQLVPFASPENPLRSITSQQAAYIAHYLDGLSAKTVLVESSYFDRDFLAEYAAFYAVTAATTPNHCRRLHFFSEEITRDRLRRAAGGSIQAQRVLQESYLGFSVLRPLHSPFGRTVLKWWPESGGHKRIMKSSRDYVCHVAGVSLSVHGLAWQQQDGGVGACATVALWTMLHSSSFDPRHAVPTTADITRAAHRTASLGARVFPSNGLSLHQMSEAIKECGLAPVVCQGDVTLLSGELRFSRSRFCTLTASLVRSGYPVLLSGMLLGLGQHAVVVTGMRAPTLPLNLPAGSYLEDAYADFVHLHDDNCGPSVRYAVVEVVDPDSDPADPNPAKFVELRRSNPDGKKGVLSTYPNFQPDRLFAAVHDDVRMDLPVFLRCGLAMTQALSVALKAVGAAVPLSFGARIVRLSDYMGDELHQLLGNDPKALARVRLGLAERAPPLSLHLGVARIGWPQGAVLDLLYDTTGSERTPKLLATVAYDHLVVQLLKHMPLSWGLDFGTVIEARP